MSLTNFYARRILVLAVISLIVGVGLIFWLSSAQAAPPSQSPPDQEVRLSEHDEGSQIKLKGNEVLVISLESNPSTGYIWETADLSVQGQPILRQLGDSQFEPQPNLLGTTQPLLGAPLQQILKFQAVAAGQTGLQLVYHRPWEKDAAPAKTFSVQVEAAAPAQVAAEPTPTPTPVPVVPHEAASGPSLLSVPANYNWCDLGKCTAIRDQGNCGSCWTFGTVGPLEANILRYDAVSTNLSEQYLLSCNSDGWSCNGGWWAHNYHLNKIPTGETAAGAVNETTFPYQTSQVACNYPSYPQPHAHQQKIVSWAYVGNSYSTPTTEAIKQAIYDYGPVGVAVCAGSAFGRYSGGVFQTDEKSTCSGGVNHAVVLVGWNDTTGTWRLRNSWGTSWGESGYMNIKYGTSNVGYAANYVVYNSGGCPDAYEADDSYTAAKSIGAGSTQSHSFHVAGDADWATLSVQAGAIYTITTTGLGGSNDTVLELYSTNGTTLLTSNNDCPGQGKASCLSWTAPANGTYFIKVKDNLSGGGCTGYGYNLTVSSNVKKDITTYLPVLLKGTDCTALQTVQNSGFEGGAANWVQQSSGGYDIIDTNFPHNGSWGAWIGGYNNANDRLYQTITLPVAPAAQLTLYLYVGTEEGTTYPYDYFHAELQNTSGQTLETFLWADNRLDSDSWYTGTMTWNDFSAHSGQTRRLVLQGTTDSSLNTNFFVDDVTLRTSCTSLGDAPSTDRGWQKIDAPPADILQDADLLRKQP